MKDLRFDLTGSCLGGGVQASSWLGRLRLGGLASIASRRSLLLNYSAAPPWDGVPSGQAPAGSVSLEPLDPVTGEAIDVPLPTVYFGSVSRGKGVEPLGVREALGEGGQQQQAGTTLRPGRSNSQEGSRGGALSLGHRPGDAGSLAGVKAYTVEGLRFENGLAAGKASAGLSTFPGLAGGLAVYTPAFLSAKAAQEAAVLLRKYCERRRGELCRQALSLRQADRKARERHFAMLHNALATTEAIKRAMPLLSSEAAEQLDGAVKVMASKLGLGPWGFLPTLGRALWASPLPSGLAGGACKAAFEAAVLTLRAGHAISNSLDQAAMATHLGPRFLGLAIGHNPSVREQSLRELAMRHKQYNHGVVVMVASAFTLGTADQDAGFHTHMAALQRREGSNIMEAPAALLEWATRGRPARVIEEWRQALAASALVLALGAAAKTPQGRQAVGEVAWSFSSVGFLGTNTPSAAAERLLGLVDHTGLASTLCGGESGAGVEEGKGEGGGATPLEVLKEANGRAKWRPDMHRASLLTKGEAEGIPLFRGLVVIGDMSPGALQQLAGAVSGEGWQGNEVGEDMPVGADDGRTLLR